MSYIVLSIIIFTFIIIAYYYKKRSLIKERFLNKEQDECIDETNTVRKLTLEEKNEVKKVKKNTKKDKKDTKKDKKDTKKDKKDTKKDSKNDKKDTKKDSKKDTKKDKKDKKEVFLIYNKYNYLDAKDICKVYDGRLATEKDLELAFKNGANWCNWGWLDGEKIGYPVQEKFWLSIEKKHKGFCGPTAGINKIYNIDPLKQYSVTCYGIKPPKSEKDKQLETVLHEITEDTSLKTQIDQCKQSKREAEKNKWLNEQKNNIRILEFNNSEWSEKNLL
jgi:hypothetical protein